MTETKKMNIPKNDSLTAEAEDVRPKKFEHLRLVIWLVLVVPIISLYLFGLSTLENKMVFLFSSIFYILVFFVGAVSLDLELGSVGLPNFGKVAFFAIGAYTSTLLHSAGVFYPIAVLVALVLSGIFGWLLAIPTIKLREDYFAIMTIAGGEIIRLLLQNEKRYLWQKDPFGIPQQLIFNSFKNQLVTTAPFDQNITIFETLGLGTVKVWQIALLIVFLIFSLLIYFFIQLLRNSPYGRTLRAIRDDDIAVTSVGKDAARFRWQIAVIAAVICGLAGVMYGLTFSNFESDNFRPLLTFNLFVFVIIGGLGNAKGAFAGTSLITLYLQAAQVDAVRSAISLRLGPQTPLIGDIFTVLQIDMIINPDNTRFVIFGVILILFLIYMPEGLIPEPRGNNEPYLKLLTPEERKRSDLAVAARQSLGEQERLTDTPEKTTKTPPS